jgi:cell filamentation protein
VSRGDPYTYPRSTVLRNKLGILNAAELDEAERTLVAQRATEGIPTGCFDLDHLKAIHRHLFQDVYKWAGEARRIEIAKDQQQFQFRRYIETGMADVHSRLTASRFLQNLSLGDFAREAGRIMGEVNYVHPFREGNGRTQLFYLGQLAEQAGHPIELTKLDARFWIAASRRSHAGDYEAMTREIHRACTGTSNDGIG